jgi:hypothetical protein
MGSKNKNDQNEFIVDSLLASAESKETKETKVEEEEEKRVSVYDNPYFLDPKDEKYFKLYIGNNYNQITTKKFNTAAFIFGGVYLIYRKCYLLGFAWTIVNLIFLILLPLLNVNTIVVLLILFISHFMCGYVANSSYVSYVGAKIVEFRSLDKNNLKNNLITKGGTDLLASSITLLVCLIIYIFCLYDVTLEYVNKYILVPDTTNNTSDQEIIIDIFKYDGELKVKSDTDISSIINLPLIDGFNDISTSNSIIYLYGDSDILPQCKMEVMELDYDTDAKTFIKGLAKYYNELDENVLEVNGLNTWYKITIVDSMKETIYNATRKNNNLILYRVTYTNDYKDTCLNYYNNTINNIE